MHAADIGTGAALTGFGVLTIVAAIMYGAPGLIPPSYVLIGAGAALFLRGFADEIPWSLTLLLSMGTGAVFLSAYLLVTRRNVPDGLALASLSLGWSLALVAVGMYRQASRSAAAARAAAAAAGAAARAQLGAQPREPPTRAHRR